MKYFRLDIYSHYFKISEYTREVRGVLNMMFKHLKHYQYARGNTNPIIKSYYSEKADHSEFRFNINTLPYFYEMLTQNGINDGNYVSMTHYPSLGVAIDVNLAEGWKPRESQVPIIEYFLREDEPHTFLPLETGGGKTFSSMAAITQIKRRTMIVLKPTFIDKWVKDIQVLTDCDPMDIMVVKGGDNLRAIISLAIADQLSVKFIIISNKTLYNYVKEYNNTINFEETGYGCKPDELYETLGIGVKLIDEVHLDFYTSFILDLYVNVARSISLSATLISRDDFLNRMYKLAYPINKRFVVKATSPYIDITAVDYTVNSSYHLPITEYGSKNYSHHVYERAMCKSYRLRNDYFSMIADVLYEGYEKDYVLGEKAIIFVISVKVCSELAEYIQHRYPDMRVSRYIAEDDYDEMLSSDIIISTPQNLGTGMDIPSLKTVINSVNIDSIQSNIQIVGRLRKRDNLPTRYYYLYNSKIDKHKRYHIRRKELLMSKAKSFVELAYSKQLG
jgi:superfamily II DNA or RNA helicase